MSDNTGYCGENCKKQRMKCIPCVTPGAPDTEKQTTDPQAQKENCKCSSDNLCCESKQKPQ